MRLEEVELLRHGSSDLAIRVSRETFGISVLPFLKGRKWLNPSELGLVSEISHLLGKKHIELTPTLRTQLMLDFIENRVDLLSTEALVQFPQEQVLGEVHGEEEEE